MENNCISECLNLFSPMALENALKDAVKVYWSKPENRKIDGRFVPELNGDVTFKNFNYRILIEGAPVDQFELLLKSLQEGKEQPRLQGDFDTTKTIDNGNGTVSVSCKFELLGKDYHVEDDGKIVIDDLFIHIKNY